MSRLRDWARRIRRDAIAVWFAARDARTPVAARLLALAVAAYAASPIDLIPDFVPVLGLLDDLLIVPAGLWLVVRMLPADVLADARRRAAAVLARPTSRVAAVVVVVLWIAVAAAAAAWWLRR